MKTLLVLPLKFIAFIIAKSPMKIQMFLGWLLGILWFDILRVRRDVVLGNLSKAYPEMSKNEKVRIGRASCVNLGMGLIEFCRFPFIQNTDKDKSQFVIKGREHFDKAKQQGKGVALMSLHLGNGDMGLMGLSLYGFKLNAITKFFKMKWANDLWFGLRGRFGTEFIPPRNSSYAVIKALRRNEPVVFVQDQFMGPPIGIKTRFFGIETGTAVGLAVIVNRLRCPIIPVYTRRLKNGQTEICFEREVSLPAEEDKEKFLAQLTQDCNDRIEQIVRKDPEMWLWVHKRWKTFNG